MDACMQGAFRVPSDKVHDLGRIIEQIRTYVETDYFFGIGIGIKESHDALKQAWQSQQPYAFYDEAAGADDTEDAGTLDASLHDQPLEKAVNDGNDHWMPAEKSQNEGQDAGGPQNPDGVAQPGEETSDMAASGGGQAQSATSGGEDSGSESGDDQQGGEEQGDDPMAIVAKALLKIKEQAAAIHTLKDQNPEAFEAVRNLVQAMVALGHQVKESGPPAEGQEAKPEASEEKTEKAEAGGVFKLLKAPKLGTKKQVHMVYPDALPSPASVAGTVKDGKIKVAPVDPLTGAPRPEGWNQARSGMIMGPKGSAVSSRTPGGE